MKPKAVVSGMAIVAAAQLLSGCETADPDLGHSVRSAVNAHAVDMAPQYAGTPGEGSDGVRSVDAQRRYLSGDVKKLSKIDGRVDQAGTQEQTANQGRTPIPDK